MGFDIIEWRNPSTAGSASGEYSSGSAQFDEFLSRGDTFGGLDLDTDQQLNSTTGRDSQRRVLLIEEFPTVLGPNSPALASFRSSLQRYLAAARSPFEAPVVIVVSETLLSSASAVSESFTVHRLLGPGICNHEGTAIIDFNSIAPTFMYKALQTVLEKEARLSKRVAVPGPLVLERISQIGDIRSAISSLEFLCLKDGSRMGGWSGSLAKKKSKKKNNDAGLTPMEKTSLDMIVQREASLGMFHAVGKIVHNKREDAILVPEGTVIPPQPPDHLHLHYRRKVSRVPVNDLVDDIGTDIQTFLCALHENYVPSCDGPLFTAWLDECIEGLSDSDVLSGDRRGMHCSTAGSSTYAGTGVDLLRQNEMSFQVATRKLLFSLPYPVKRRATKVDGHGARDAFKMFFPDSLRLWTECERMEGLIDTFVKRNYAQPVAGATNTETGGVGSWRKSLHADGAFMDRENPHDAREVAATTMSRNDLLLFQLPYMAKIPHHGAGAEVAELTSFGSLSMSNGKATGSYLGRHLAGEGSHLSQGPSPPYVEEERLVLSDDDIEDD